MVSIKYSLQYIVYKITIYINKYVYNNCMTKTIDEIFNNLEPEYKLPRPHCTGVSGGLEYRSEQKEGTYCCLEAESCPYYSSVKNKDYCLYELGKYLNGWTVNDYYEVLSVGDKYKTKK